MCVCVCLRARVHIVRMHVYYECVHMRVCVRACVCGCVHVWVQTVQKALDEAQHRENSVRKHQQVKLQARARYCIHLCAATLMSD